jgi:hypothetical protein
VLLLACLAAISCGRKPTSAPTPPPASAPGGSVDALLAKPADAAPAAPEAPTTASAPGESPDAQAGAPQVAEASVQQLTEAVRVWLQVYPDYPKDLKELVDKKLIPKLPAPPPGKKFAIDRKSISVILVDK